MSAYSSYLNDYRNLNPFSEVELDKVVNLSLGGGATGSISNYDLNANHVFFVGNTGACNVMLPASSSLSKSKAFFMIDGATGMSAYNSATGSDVTLVCQGGDKFFNKSSSITSHTFKVKGDTHIMYVDADNGVYRMLPA